MAKFDTILVHQVSFSEFEYQHCNVAFQTQDLDLEPSSSEYSIFNDQLYLAYDANIGKRLEQPTPCKFNGEAQIYTKTVKSDVEYWIEYDLVFNEGILVSVKQSPKTITADRRDLSMQRPAAPGNRVVLKFDIQDMDEARKEAFVHRIHGKLDDIRDLIDEPDATIYYPAFPRTDSGSVLSLAMSRPKYFMVGSFVQRLSDFNDNNIKRSIQAPNGDQITFILDEYQQYAGRVNLPRAKDITTGDGDVT